MRVRHSAQILQIGGAGGVAIIAGLGVATVGRIPVSELALAALIPMGVIIWRRRGAAHPAAWFPLCFATYFLIGAQNWVSVTGSSVVFRAYVAPSSLFAPALGGVAFSAVALLVAAGKRSPTAVAAAYETADVVPEQETTEDSQRRRIALLLGRVFLLLGVLGVAIAVHRFGVLILHPANRADLPGWMRLQSLFLIPGALLFSCAKVSRRAELAILIGAATALGLLAYRTPILLMLATYIVTRLLTRELRERAAVVIVIALAAFAGLIYSLRLSEAGSNPYASSVTATGGLSYVPGLTPLYYSSAREGVAVWARLASLIPSAHPFFGGSIQGSAITSLLPGKQSSPRLTVSSLAYGTSTPTTSLTPTLVGGPYLDFGVIGVILELGLLGLIVTLLYRQAVRERTRRRLRVMPYAYAVALVALSIHAGLLDAMLYLVLPVFTLAGWKWTSWVVAHC